MSTISHQIFSFGQIFWNYLEISAPYLLIGLLFSGIIHHFLPTHLIRKWLGGHKLSSVFKASLVGVPLPLCSCSVIPTAIALRKSGASKSATSAFMISTPESGIDSVIMTYGVMDLPMTIIRPSAAFFSASLAGVVNYFFEKREEKKIQPVQPIPHSIVENNNSNKLKWNSFLHYGFVELLDDMIGWLLFGLLCGALISWVVPEDFFLRLDPMISKLGITLLATLLYICASASTPVAASLILKGMSPGTALIFLLLGPATNISNIIIMQKYLGRRTMAINLLAIVVVAFGFSVFVDYGYQHWWNVESMQIFKKFILQHDHGPQASWIPALSAWLLSILIMSSLWRVYLRRYFTNKSGPHNHDHAKACCSHKERN
jgi:uncharacterized membrane protein YraQ (UPF0718 family)